MAKALITLSLLANTGLALALQKNEPFDACEVWADGPATGELIHIRLYDRQLGDRCQENQRYCARAYHEGVEVDGSDRESTLPVHSLEWSIDAIRSALTKAFGFTPAGRPRKWDRHELYDRLMHYVDITDIPIIAEFATEVGIDRQKLYEMDELSDALKRCVQKKETALERKALQGDVNVTMAIFSLKQLGWKDVQGRELSAPGGGPIVISSTDAEL